MTDDGIVRKRKKRVLPRKWLILLLIFIIIIILVAVFFFLAHDPLPSGNGIQHPFDKGGLLSLI